jgi:hypothetical protein
MWTSQVLAKRLQGLRCDRLYGAGYAAVNVYVTAPAPSNHSRVTPPCQTAALLLRLTVHYGLLVQCYGEYFVTNPMNEQ